MLVVDTSVLAPLYLPGERTAEVEELLRREAHWIGPSLWRSELLNVLCTYHRVRGLALSDCLDIWELAEERMRGRTYATVPLKVLECASNSGCSGYDAEFLSLAAELEVPLLTYDRKLIERSGGIASEPADWLRSNTPPD